MLSSLSSLDDSGLEKIKSLEKELGKSLLSFSCHDLTPAELNDNDLEKVKGIYFDEFLIQG